MCTHSVMLFSGITESKTIVVKASSNFELLEINHPNKLIFFPISHLLIMMSNRMQSKRNKLKNWRNSRSGPMLSILIAYIAHSTMQCGTRSACKDHTLLLFFLWYNTHILYDSVFHCVKEHRLFLLPFFYCDVLILMTSFTQFFIYHSSCRST